MVGYLGMRIFAPCPVSALLDSIGGVAPLLGLIAMCSDSHGLYASLKVLVSAVQTNRSIVNEVARSRGYQVNKSFVLVLQSSRMFRYFLNTVECYKISLDHLFHTSNN